MEEALERDEALAQMEDGTDEVSESIQSKGVTLAPYGDELHWYQWSRATADYNRTLKTFDLDGMEKSLRERIATLQGVWSEGVLEFKYLQEVRDLIFDTLDVFGLRSSTLLAEDLRSLFVRPPSDVQASSDWKILSLEIGSLCPS